MQILSSQVRITEARKVLRKSRFLAISLLFMALIFFVVSAIYEQHYPLLSYVKAFSEAAMVGALADWFAITALFRRPLGLPIPHTAILPRNQYRIAEELGRFIKHNFLLGRPIALRIYQAKPSEKLLNWLSQEEVRNRWLPWLLRRWLAILKMVNPENAARFVTLLLVKQYGGDQIGQSLANGLRIIQSQGIHKTLLLTLLKQQRRWLRNPETQVLLEKNLHQWAAKIESEAPTAWQRIKASLKGSLVDKVDGWVAEKALDWADSYLADAIKDSNHHLWLNFDEQYAHMIDALEHSRLWHKRLELGKEQLIKSDSVKASLEHFWRNLKSFNDQDMSDAQSLWQEQINKLINHLLWQVQRHPQLLRRIDVCVSLVARDFVMKYKDLVAIFVADKVKSWDSQEMVEKIELSVGKDLQFIRINGTLVGGLVGLLIYMLSKYLF